MDAFSARFFLPNGKQATSASLYFHNRSSPHVFAHITAHTPHDEPRRDHPMFIPGVDVGIHAPRALPRAPPLGPRAFLAGPKREVQIRNRPAQGEGAAARRRPARAASAARAAAFTNRPRLALILNRRPPIPAAKDHHARRSAGGIWPRKLQWRSRWMRCATTGCPLRRATMAVATHLCITELLRI